MTIWMCAHLHMHVHMQSTTLSTKCSSNSVTLDRQTNTALYASNIRWCHYQQFQAISKLQCSHIGSAKPSTASCTILSPPDLQSWKCIVTATLKTSNEIGQAWFNSCSIHCINFQYCTTIGKLIQQHLLQLDPIFVQQFIVATIELWSLKKRFFRSWWLEYCNCFFGFGMCAAWLGNH